tara:strand:- start:735 stop:1193 length:459 start_codon:yes stop_codon:yes gene_type:complete
MATTSRAADVALADGLTLDAVRLTRWLRAADPAPTLSGPQASALAVVVHAGRIRMSDLARVEEVSRPTVTRIARELLTLGLIARTIDPADARVSWLTATRSGRARLAAGQARRLEPLVSALDALSPADRSSLVAGAAVLNELITRSIGLPRP